MFGGLAILAVVARKVLPTFITQVMVHGGQELTTLFAVMMACGGAYAAQLAGWPPALGACIAGLLLANADIRHQLVAEIRPFRDVFNALFFIALGMTVHLEVVFRQFDWMLTAIAFTLVVKIFITVSAVKLAGWPYRVAFQVGVGLCSVSEFGYVLARQADTAGLLPENFMDGMIGYTVGTMIAGSILFPLGTRFTGKVSVILNQIDSTRLASKDDAEETTEDDLSGHVVIVGFGINGENLVRVLKATQIPHCVIEMNQGLIHKAREMGAPVVVGDATRRIILEHAGIKHARAIVIAVNTQEDTRRIVSQSRRLNPGIYIAVRTYFVKDLDSLAEQGVNVVVPADFEASVKIFSHVLEEFNVPRNILASQIAAVRAGDYGVFRGRSSSSNESLQDLLKVLELTSTQTFYLPESSPACGRTIADLNLRRETGATIIAVVRERIPDTNPGADFELKASDVLVLVGAHEQLRDARNLLGASSHLTSARVELQDDDS
jgi:CPA2 family monovalent cation:H+ antiporter-2